MKILRPHFLEKKMCLSYERVIFVEHKRGDFIRELFDPKLAVTGRLYDRGRFPFGGA